MKTIKAMKRPPGTRKITIQFYMPQVRVNQLDMAMAASGILTRRQFFDEAMTLFEWAIECAHDGNKVGVLNKGIFNPLLSTALKRVKPL